MVVGGSPQQHHSLQCSAWTAAVFTACPPPPAAEAHPDKTSLCSTQSQLGTQGLLPAESCGLEPWQDSKWTRAAPGTGRCRKTRGRASWPLSSHVGREPILQTLSS